MWGYFVELAGVGPKACPVIKLTTEKLVEAFNELGTERIKTRAAELADAMAREDGIEGGLVHFLDCLPRENMLCDVSLLLGETAIARYELLGTHIKSKGIKVSCEVAAYLEGEKRFKWRRLFTSQRRLERRMYAKGMRRHAIMSYNLAGHIRTFHHGIFAAFVGCFCGLVLAPFQFYRVSDRFARNYGAFGCLFGVVVSVFYIVYDVVIAVMIFFDRLIIAFTNGLFGKQYEAVLDFRRHTRVHDTPKVVSEKDTYLKNGITKARRHELQRALLIVAKARSIFEECNPHFPRHHKHYNVVTLPRLLEALGSDSARNLLNLSVREAAAVAEALDSNSLPKASSVRRLAMFPPGVVDDNDNEKRVSSEMETSRTAEHNSDTDEQSVPAPCGSHKAKVAAFRTQDRGTTTVQESDEDKYKFLERPDPLKESVESNRSESKSTKNSKFFRSIMDQLQNFKRTKPEKTDISFTQFIQALHGVCGEKVLHETVRKLERPTDLDGGLSQYLS